MSNSLKRYRSAIMVNKGHKGIALRKIISLELTCMEYTWGSMLRENQTNCQEHNLFLCAVLVHLTLVATRLDCLCKVVCALFTWFVCSRTECLFVSSLRTIFFVFCAVNGKGKEILGREYLSVVVRFQVDGRLKARTRAPLSCLPLTVQSILYQLPICKLVQTFFLTLAKSLDWGLTLFMYQFASRTPYLSPQISVNSENLDAADKFVCFVQIS